MLRKAIMIINKLILILMGAGLAILLLPSLIAHLATFTKIHSVGKSDAARVAIVFGAGLYRDGSPTPYYETVLLPR